MGDGWFRDYYVVIICVLAEGKSWSCFDACSYGLSYGRFRFGVTLRVILIRLLWDEKGFVFGDGSFLFCSVLMKIELIGVKFLNVLLVVYGL